MPYNWPTVMCIASPPGHMMFLLSKPATPSVWPQTAVGRLRPSECPSSCVSAASLRFGLPQAIKAISLCPTSTQLYAVVDEPLEPYHSTR